MCARTKTAQNRIQNPKFYLGTIHVLNFNRAKPPKSAQDSIFFFGFPKTTGKKHILKCTEITELQFFNLEKSFCLKSCL
jgi:hypothetical protein